MAYMLVRHNVKDYPAWKRVFDDLIDTRRASGEKTWQIWHQDDDPHNLWLLFEWDNLKNARAFANSEALKEAMQKAGVTGHPDIQFLEENDRGVVK